MRWLNEKPPEFGDVRTRRAFLLLPRTIQLETRWLERGAWTEQFVYSTVSGDIWRPLRWIESNDGRAGAGPSRGHDE